MSANGDTSDGFKHMAHPVAERPTTPTLIGFDGILCKILTGFERELYWTETLDLSTCPSGDGSFLLIAPESAAAIENLKTYTITSYRNPRSVEIMVIVGRSETNL